jgi:hypothetical protein
MHVLAPGIAARRPARHDDGVRVDGPEPPDALAEQPRQPPVMREPALRRANWRSRERAPYARLRPSRSTSYLPTADVPVVAAGLSEVDKAWLRSRLDSLGATDGELFEYVWDALEGLRRFYARLVERKEAMVFTVSG